MKCNGCGADLPYDAFGRIKCDFCGSQNYVPLPPDRGEPTKEPVKEEVQAPVEEIEPEPPAETQKQEVHINTEDKPSNLWYLVPLLFGLVGGYFTYNKVRKRNPKISKCFLLAFVLPVLFKLNLHGIYILARSNILLWTPFVMSQSLVGFFIVLLFGIAPFYPMSFF